MKKSLFHATLLFGCALICVASCKKDKLDPVCDGSEPTFEDGISTIINANCMGSSCHGAGSSRGDFTSYAKMEAFLNNGSFEREVLDDQTMPQGGDLTQNEINSIQCWVDNNYPEN